jgi:dipeptidase E
MAPSAIADFTERLPLTQRLLLLSSSRVAGAGYLDAYEDDLREFLGPNLRAACFVPFAGVTLGPDEYSGLVAERLGRMGVPCASLHREPDPPAALERADAVVVGGGNTFQLLATMQRTGLLAAVRARVRAGLPYVGWSAGANLACPTIRTTNDMPVVEPDGFGALGLVPFQINPHYSNALPPGHMGETRDQRIAELLVVDPTVVVAGLREGSALRVEGARVTLLGPHPLRLFRAGQVPVEVDPGDVTRVLAG